MKAHLVSFLVLLVTAHCLGQRSKRVIDGVPLYERPDTYKSVRYVGALARPHVHVNWVPLWTVWRASGALGFIRCTGSLITPVIFQTACHCVAEFNHRDNKLTAAASMFSIWEERKVVYVGVSNRFNTDEIKFSMATSKSIEVDKYIVHSRCAQHRLSRYLTYDYGIVQLNDYWYHTDPFAWTEITYAPQYTIQDMRDFHVYALKKRLVCMTLGWGQTGRFEWTRTDVLRHGWVVLKSHEECAAATVGPFGWTRRAYNWVCYKEFPRHDQGPWVEDWGGPLTCNDRYFGIFSLPIWKPIRGINAFKKAPEVSLQGMYGAVVHNPFVNSVNYRQALLNSLFRLGSTYSNDKQTYVMFRRGSRNDKSVRRRDLEFGAPTSQAVKDGSKPFTVYVVCMYFYVIY